VRRRVRIATFNPSFEAQRKFGRHAILYGPDATIATDSVNGTVLNMGFTANSTTNSTSNDSIAETAVITVFVDPHTLVVQGAYTADAVHDDAMATYESTRQLLARNSQVLLKLRLLKKKHVRNQ